MEDMKLVSNATGNWEIYRRIEIINEKAHIIRFPKICHESRVKDYIDNYELIKSIGIPSLQIVKKVTIDGKVAVQTDDLNYGQERIYVTPNSVYTDYQKKVDELASDFNGTNNLVKKVFSEWDQYRYANKIKHITNFTEFLLVVGQSLRRASVQHIFIEYDSYFFGSEKSNETSLIDYKIVDLDNIYIRHDLSSERIYKENLGEFYRAMESFIEYFIIDDSRHKYATLLNEYMNSRGNKW